MTVPPAPRFRNGVCLIVEDVAETRDFLGGLVRSVFPALQIALRKDVAETREWIRGRNANRVKNPLVLALVDLGLPDGSGTDVIRELRAEEPDTPSVVVTIYDDDERLFRALTAGASGYLLKGENREILRSLLARIERGEPPLSPTIAHRMLEHFRVPFAEGNPNSNSSPASDTVPKPANPDAHVAPTPVGLTPRESETLVLIARGRTVAEAAAELKISPQTVAGYVKSIYRKLHVSNRAEAVREAIRRGLA